MTAAWKTWPAPERGADMWAWQDGRCAWCGCDAHLFYSRRMAKDHCHETVLVRGYLCAGCNTAEGINGGPEWDEWRNGDHPAQAIGHFEIYRNSLGGTPLSPRSALNYYTYEERLMWWLEVKTEVAAGGSLPSDAPWSELAAACRDAELEKARVGIANMFGRAAS